MRLLISKLTCFNSIFSLKFVDVALTVVWSLLALGGIAFQLRRERDFTRAPFPSTPSWPAWLGFRKVQTLWQRNPSEITENTPLLT